ncbi:molecular chaperone DnaJ/curved DNA-binding protein [Abditibacterium utsteinense]|uniref:Molecular chaperone DnaJ/curved DNA-binding protein n=1 Tax=Abditibacterium utsteinense TaxID=1960156 RepID=A0A2S8STF0_9BACT|nr:J domain-containing protein [Abditibacterium utsteinense]PQV64058.1 molecular chaperone DnaJ/curved DNA-binding protein [Abditibacterium utsteinense]
MAKDFYQVLGLKRDADEKAIKGAYRKLAREHHPDVNPGNAGAEAKFKQIAEAFQVLSDPEKRKLYDQFGDDYDKIPPEYAKYGPQGAGRQSQGQGGFPGQQSGGFPGQQSGGFSGGAGGVNFEELLRQAQATQGPGGARGSASGGGSGDLFGSLFGGLRGQGRRTPERGGDVEQAVSISFAESIQGTQRRFNLLIQGERGQEKRDVTVKIPALISDGATVKVSGKGASSSSGGANGDLFLKISVQPGAFWKRDGLNLKIEVTVSFAEAALGATIQVPTAGNEVGLKIPAGTQSGATFRLSGRGLHNEKTDAKGDLLVSIKVAVPKALSPREEQLIRELAALRSEDLRGALPKSL